MELCLGTVQFGMQYGIASKGRPDYNQAEKMLEYAFEHRIRTIDTAGAYGEAEQIVGDFLANIGRGEVNIITKIRPGILYNVEPGNYYQALKDALKGSLRNLRTNYVDGCLFHNAEYALNEEALAALNKLKKDRMVKKTGISIYLPREFSAAIASPFVDIIQIPYNILDTRLDGLLKKTNQEIFARSAFLQGLLLMNLEDVPPALADIKPYILRIDSFCDYHGYTRLSLLLNFLKSQPKIDKLVFGVDNIDQLKEIIDAYNAPVDLTAVRELTYEFAGIDERIISPNLWHGEYK